MVNNIRPFFIVILIACFFDGAAFGADQSNGKRDITSSDIKRETKEAAKTTGEYIHHKKDEYQRKAEERLHGIDVKVRELYLKAERKASRIKEKISSSADDLSRKGEKAKEKLKELKESGEERWTQLRSELDAMIKDIEKSYNRTVSRFKD